MLKSLFDRKTTKREPEDINGRNETGLSQDSKLKSAEGWEACLRRQITTHPRIALGLGLTVGLAMGWWVKR